MVAFAGESQARNKYTYYASKAKKEGYVQIQKIFEETAANEKEHAELWFKLFHGVGTTEENFLDASHATGQGTTGGRGMNGQKSRSGGCVRLGFEGGADAGKDMSIHTALVKPR